MLTSTSLLSPISRTFSPDSLASCLTTTTYTTTPPQSTEIDALDPSHSTEGQLTFLCLPTELRRQILLHVYIPPSPHVSASETQSSKLKPHHKIDLLPLGSTDGQWPVVSRIRARTTLPLSTLLVSRSIRLESLSILTSLSPFVIIDFTRNHRVLGPVYLRQFPAYIRDTISSAVGITKGTYLSELSRMFPRLSHAREITIQAPQAMVDELNTHPIIDILARKADKVVLDICERSVPLWPNVKAVADERGIVVEYGVWVGNPSMWQWPIGPYRVVGEGGERMVIHLVRRSGRVEVREVEYPCRSLGEGGGRGRQG